MEPDLVALHYFQAPLPTFASGTQVAIVEIDPAHRQVTILDYVSVSDAVPRINPTVVDGQIQGGIAQGIGGALMEEILYDEEAQPLGSFLDYAIPRSTRHPGRAAGSPGDALAAQPARGQRVSARAARWRRPAVLAAAVEDALAPLGVEITRTPVTASSVWRLMQTGEDRPPPPPGPLSRKRERGNKMPSPSGRGLG